MIKDRYFDREGKPIVLLEWVKLFENKEYHVIKQDEIGKYFVSTVWLGLNHNFSDKGKPIIFETLVFEKKKYPSDCDGERYSTEEEALAGHKKFYNQYAGKATLIDKIFTFIRRVFRREIK